MRKYYATDRVGTDNQDFLQDIPDFIPGQNVGDIVAGWGDQVAIEISADFGGPDATADGGKEGSGGGGGTGGDTTSGGTTGGGTSGGGTTGGGTTTGGTTTSTFPSVTTLWPTLNPPTGDAALPTDTYFSQQWGLTKINVTKAWQNYTGAGIKVGVIDDGFDYNQSDLKPHYLFNLDYDATNGGADAYGLSTDSHGTTVMGVIAAARDGSGVVGVAYNAGLAGFRISYS